MHWSYEAFNECVSSAMSRNRWEEIKSCLHLAGNNKIDKAKGDKFAEVRPLVEHLRGKFKKIPMTEHLCIGELSPS